MSILHKDCPLNLYTTNTEEGDYYKIDFSYFKKIILNSNGTSTNSIKRFYVGHFKDNFFYLQPN